MLSLLRSGESFAAILTILPTLREHAIRKIAEKYRIKRASLWDSLAPDVKARIIAEIRERKNHACAIAAKFNVPYTTVLRIAHRELGVPTFRPSRTRQPLDSNFPLRHEHSA